MPTSKKILGNKKIKLERKAKKLLCNWEVMGS